MNENDRAITGVVTVGHAMVHTYELSLPFLASIWQAQFESLWVPLVGTVPVTDFVVGVVLTLGYAPFGLGALPGGVLTDAYGSRSLIVTCLLGMGASFLVLALSPSLLVVGAALFVWGVAASVYHPSGLSLISTGASQRGSVFAYHGIAGNLGIALGPLATALLLVVTDWRVTAGLLAIPAVVGAIAAARIEVDEAAAVADEEAARASGSVSSPSELLADSRELFAGAFLAVFGVVMLSGLYYRGLLTFLPQLLAEFPALAPIDVAGREIQSSRYVYVGLLMAGVAGQFVGGKLTDRLPVELGLVGGYGVLAVLAVLFLPVAATGLAGLVVMVALVGVFLFLVQPFYQATVAEHTPAGARGLSYGYTYLGVFGVGALGGAVAGGLLTYFDRGVLFLVLAGFAALASALGLFVYTRR